MMRDLRQAALNVSGGILVVATLGLLGYLCWGLIHREIAINNKDAMMLVLGVLLAKYSDLIAFFFGGSSQTKRQTETIDKLAETAQAAQAALPTNGKPDVVIEPGQTATVSAQDDK